MIATFVRVPTELVAVTSVYSDAVRVAAHYTAELGHPATVRPYRGHPALWAVRVPR